MKKIKEFEKKITNENVLFFDMDGTLIDTNLANYLSYKKAIQDVIQHDSEILYDSKYRFNRSILKKTIPNLTEAEYQKITQQKEIYYKDFLQK